MLVKHCRATLAARQDDAGLPAADRGPSQPPPPPPEGPDGRRGLFFALLAALLLAGAPSAAAQELAVSVGRATANKDVDVVRLAYRRELAPSSARWWWPTHVQVGAGIWRVPQLDGRTRRLDAAATAVWRAERRFGYFEAGFGAHLLSHTINNDTTRLPSAFQFGSHLGAGLRLGEAAALGIAIQHLSNAGIKEPNGGIDFILIRASLAL